MARKIEDIPKGDVTTGSAEVVNQEKSVHLYSNHKLTFELSHKKAKHSICFKAAARPSDILKVCK